MQGKLMPRAYLSPILLAEVTVSWKANFNNTHFTHKQNFKGFINQGHMAHFVPL